MVLVQNMVKSGPRVPVSSSQWRRFVVGKELKWCWACLILVHAEYERRWNMYATTVDIAKGETYPIWSDMLYVRTLCEHSHESPTMMNSCSKQITAPFLCGC